MSLIHRFIQVTLSWHHLAEVVFTALSIDGAILPPNCVCEHHQLGDLLNTKMHRHT